MKYSLLYNCIDFEKALIMKKDIQVLKFDDNCDAYSITFVTEHFTHHLNFNTKDEMLESYKSIKKWLSK